jgi:hypothetical protein
MMVEIYIWSWVHLHPAHVRRTLVRLLGISAIILLPLLALNLTLIKRGFTPQTPSLEINLSQTHYPGDVPGE